MKRMFYTEWMSHLMSSESGTERWMGSDLDEWALKKVAIQFEARRGWHYGFGSMVQCNCDGILVRGGLLIPRLHS